MAEIIKIFVASSLYLKEERDEIRQRVNKVIDNTTDAETAYKLFMAENYDDDFVTIDGTQVAYNKIIEEVDILILFFKDKVGNITRQEFDVAYKIYEQKGKPEIFIFQSNEQNNMPQTSEDLKKYESRVEFIEYVRSLNHYLTPYTSIDRLLLLISDKLRSWIFRNKHKSFPDKKISIINNLIVQELAKKLDRHDECNIIWNHAFRSDVPLMFCLQGSLHDNLGDLSKCIMHKNYDPDEEVRNIVITLGCGEFSCCDLLLIKKKINSKLKRSLQLNLNSCNNISDLIEHTNHIKCILFEIQVDTGWINMKKEIFKEFICWINDEFRSSIGSYSTSPNHIIFLLTIIKNDGSNLPLNVIQSYIVKNKIEDNTDYNDLKNKIIDLGEISKVNKNDIRNWGINTNLMCNEINELCDKFGDVETNMKDAINFLKPMFKTK